MKQELGNLMAEDPHQETINLLNYRLNAVTIERDEWKAKFIQQNKDLGCEMMDPNGTIWDHAKKLQGDLAAVTEQRDRLAEACKALMKIVGEPNSTIDDCWVSEDEMDAAWNMGNEALADVKGGADE